MPKEQPTYHTPDRPLPPRVVFQNPEKNGHINKDGFNEGLYQELTVWAKSEIPALLFPDTFEKVDLKIKDMLSAYDIDTRNSYLSLAMRHKPAIKSILHKFVEKVQIEEMKNSTIH